MEELLAASAETAMNEICRRAVREGASDVHIEPGPEAVRVRFRRDGAMEERFRLRLSMAEKLAVRCKVMGRMNVAESRTPQDGSAVFSEGGEDYDLRLSVLPSLYGETIAVRILSGRVPFIEQNELGMLPVQEAAFRRCLSGRSGLILTTGPTGSGKTSTLYAALRLLNRPEVNIISVEDPVEYRIPGVTQVAVNEKAGLTFAAGLRALVRQGPGHPHGGRDPRQGDRGDGRARRAHGAPRAVHAPHEQRLPGAAPPRRHGRRAVSHRGVAFARHVPAPRAPPLPAVPPPLAGGIRRGRVRSLRRDGPERADGRF